MKPHTEVWLRCESVGRPKSTMTHYGRLDECIRKLVEWLMSAYMGSKIRISFARTEAELGADRRSADVADIMGDLESLIPAGEEDSDGHS